ncbi:MAG: TetR/AcrR family transcriptional regulator [Bacteroidota bacterium]|nr:TetR/AcrR family transcriptional regulator [Bacteroidota bacterium]
MNTALKLFAVEGYYVTSISKIASAANISKGLLYNYFKSKEDLLSEIFHLGMDELFKDFDPNHDGVLTEEELIFFIDKTFQKLNENKDFWKLYFILIMKPSVFKIYEKRFMELVAPLFQTLENYYSAKGSKNPNAEARLLGAILDGVGMHYILDPENFPIEIVKQIIIEKHI